MSQRSNSTTLLRVLQEQTERTAEVLREILAHTEKLAAARMRESLEISPNGTDPTADAQQEYLMRVWAAYDRLEAENHKIRAALLGHGRPGAT